MKRLLFVIVALAAFAQGQTTTTITGTVKDLTQANVTSGKVTFTLAPSKDTTISGVARFTPNTITCLINGSGLVKALDGTSVCTITMNTAISPPGSWYAVKIWPGNVPTSSFTMYAVLSTYDISTIVPTPTTSPAQNYVDVFSTQTIFGMKTFGSNAVFNGTATFAGAATFAAAVSYAAGVTFNGSVSFLGGVSGLSFPVGSVITICDSSGEYLRGECYTNLATALTSADCPATGCTVDMSSPGASRALGTVDPSTKVVKVILGSFQTYTMDHLVCRNGIEFAGRGLIGLGAGTYIQSVGSNSQPLIVNPQTNNYAHSCSVHNIEFAGATANTSQKGLFFDVSTLTTASMQNLAFDHLWFSGFLGSQIELKGRPADANSAIQFSTWHDINAYGDPAQVSPTVKMTGYVAQITCDTCTFNAQNSQDALYMGPSSGTSNSEPSSIVFPNLTLQGLGVCGHFGGVTAITIIGGFVEACPTGFSLTADSSGTSTNSNNGITIENMYNPGSAATTAFLTTVDPNAVGTLRENGTYNSSGAFVNGANASRISYCGNYGAGASLICYIANRLALVFTTVGGLGAAAAGNAGQMGNVSDSTAVAAEGQTCVGGNSNKALAYSNGSVWKCF